MSLDTYSTPDELYLCRGEEVNNNRPLFTGDVFAPLSVAGLDEPSMVMVVAHPCSFRAGAVLADRVLVAAVRPSPTHGPGAWSRGLFDRAPLPDLQGQGCWAAHLDEIARAPSGELERADRIACLSEIGINILQQRLTHHLTRAEIPTSQFNQAFAHTLEEADLLEEWLDILTGAEWDKTDATAAFDTLLGSGDPPLRQQLREPQRRATIRTRCRREATVLAGKGPRVDP